MVDFDNPDAVLVDRKVAESTVSSDTDSFTEEWLFRGGSFLDIHALARTYEGSFHPDSDQYKVKSISLSPFGEINGRVQSVAQVSYSRSDVNVASGGRDTEDPVFSFSAGGGTKHVTTGKLIKRFGSQNTDYIPHPGELIGWNGDNSRSGFHVAGVDVPTAQIKETWEREYRMSALTTKWRRRIASMIGTCNSSPFKGWEKGEVLLVDCSFSGATDSSERIKVRFDFAIKPNEKNAQVAKVNIGDVEGWQYVWVIPMPHVSGGEPVISGVYVSQVVDYSNFKELGL